MLRLERLFRTKNNNNEISEREESKENQTIMKNYYNTKSTPNLDLILYCSGRHILDSHPLFPNCAFSILDLSRTSNDNDTKALAFKAEALEGLKGFWDSIDLLALKNKEG